MKMDYIKAVELAKEGKEQGFEFLYESTYKSKYYLALQYMKDEESAKDVLQEAYMKAFSKLKDLEQPEAFSGWFGKIVANTAKNMLAKKNPYLFSDIVSDEETEGWEYQIEDVCIDNQPELSYTRQETKELVHELIDSLSEEQRMCILLFYIEEMSIKEIASILDCSENTVKSRLNYGRKNLKVKAEDLQKKGYKLYGIAPLPLLLLLLRTESHAMTLERTVGVTEKIIKENPFSSFNKGKSGCNLGEVQSNVESIATKSFLHTIARKISMVGLIACVVGGTLIGINSKQDEYTISAQIEEKYIESSGTSQRVKGTLTNHTEEDWTQIDLIFLLVDSEQQPVEVGGIVPKLRADISELSAGETKEFVTSWFPAVLESDFDKVKGYQVKKIKYDDGKK